MRVALLTFSVVLTLQFVFVSPLFGQDENESVNVALRVTKESELSCQKFEAGAPEILEGPDYPLEAKAAKVSGPVRIELSIDEKGQPRSVIKTTGPEQLQDAARTASMRSRFKPSRCDGKAVPVNAIIVFNFVLLELNDKYIQPVKAEDFTDLSPNSPFYEAIVTITNNYGLGFGYADRGFHPNAPLSKGDFSHFLRMTLDLLQERATVANKIPGEINLFYQYNPRKLKSTAQIRDLQLNKPYARSVGILVSKYNIAFVDDQSRFRGNIPLRLSEVIRDWQAIFGNDAIPINFNNASSEDRIVTRGEFALFLHESLFVLTYKVLP